MSSWKPVVMSVTAALSHAVDAHVEHSPSALSAEKYRHRGTLRSLPAAEDVGQWVELVPRCLPTMTVEVTQRRNERPRLPLLYCVE